MEVTGTPGLAPSPQSEAVTSELQELSLQPAPDPMPLQERKNGETLLHAHFLSFQSPLLIPHFGVWFWMVSSSWLKVCIVQSRLGSAAMSKQQCKHALRVKCKCCCLPHKSEIITGLVVVVIVVVVTVVFSGCFRKVSSPRSSSSIFFYCSYTIVH